MVKFSMSQEESQANYLNVGALKLEIQYSLQENAYFSFDITEKKIGHNELDSATNISF